jgi:ParB-like chromosome segregation protein Spo0J
VNRRTFERQLSFARIPAPIPLDQLQLRQQTARDEHRVEHLRGLQRSVERFGQLAPVVVIPVRPGTRSSNDSQFLVVDGELRVTGLQLLRAKSAVCIQPVAKSLTGTERLNLPSIAQEHQILARAVEMGLPVGYLAEVFGIEPSAIALRLGMLRRICPAALRLIGDTPASEGAYRCLRRLTPERQVEVAQAMLDLEDFSARVALALVRSTPGTQFVRKPRFVWPDGDRTSAATTRSAFSVAAAETRRLAVQHPHAALELCILTAHVRALLSNTALVRWLALHRPDQLQRLVALSEPPDTAAPRSQVSSLPRLHPVNQ